MGNEEHFLVMEFCNGYVVPLLKDKDRYISTKRDADSHGIGLHTVGKLVKKYAGIMRVEDLFQIGSIGLLKAIDKFDLTYDVRFSTYAVPIEYDKGNDRKSLKIRDF